MKVLTFIILVFLAACESEVDVELKENNGKSIVPDSEGESAALKITLQSSDLDQSEIGSTTSATFELENISEDQNLDGLSEILSATGVWSITNNTCSSLGPGETCSVTVSLEPNGVGAPSTKLGVFYEVEGDIKKIEKELSADVPAKTVTVAATYPANGVNWNDYIRVTDFSKDKNNQSDTACYWGLTGLKYCFHGGERRKISLSFLDSCSGIAAEDALDAFEWTCAASDSGIDIFSVGLKDGKSLADLLNETSFKENSISIKKDGVEVAVSDPSVWWGNTVLPLPDNSSGSTVALTNNGESAGRIYTLAASRTSPGYNLADDKLAVVTLGDSVLRHNGDTSGNCNYSTGKMASPSYSALLCAGSEYYLWIEGKYDGNGSVSRGLYAKSAYWARIADFELTGAADLGAYFMNLKNAKIQGLKLDNKLGGRAAYSLFNEITVANVEDRGIQFDNCLNCLFHNIRVFNNKYEGMYLNSSNNAVVTGIVAASNGGSGLQISHSINVVVKDLLSVNNANHGFKLYDSSGTASGRIGVNLALINNGWLWNHAGLALENTVGDKFYNVVGMFNEGYGVQLRELTVAQDDADFKGYLKIGGNGTRNCEVDTSGSAPGLIHSTCSDSGSDGSSVYTGQTSAATLITSNTDISASFVGKVSGDSVNAEADGAATSDNISDWLGFENQFRSWGMEGSAFPNLDNKKRCASGSACHIWDWSLQSTDTVFRNKSGDGVNDNENFTAGETCPAIVHGDQSLSNSNSNLDNFLVHAAELMGDGSGNDNGLCESDEACVYAPNIGVYQGHGDYMSNGTCLFQDGTGSNPVTGVTMYAYPQNGY